MWYVQHICICVGDGYIISDGVTTKCARLKIGLIKLLCRNSIIGWRFKKIIKWILWVWRYDNATSIMRRPSIIQIGTQVDSIPVYHNCYKYICRIKHNWHCRGLENRSCGSMWEFESLIRRHMRNRVALKNCSLKREASVIAQIGSRLHLRVIWH